MFFIKYQIRVSLGFKLKTMVCFIHVGYRGQAFQLRYAQNKASYETLITLCKPEQKVHVFQKANDITPGFLTGVKTIKCSLRIMQYKSMSNLLILLWSLKKKILLKDADDDNRY